MIRHSILIDSDYKKRKAGDGKKNNKSVSNSKNNRKLIAGQRISISDEVANIKTAELRNRKNNFKFSKTSSIGRKLIQIELILVFLLVIGMVGWESFKIDSWWFFTGVIISFVGVLWAIGHLPCEIKNIVKTLYFRVHVLFFMGIIICGGYFLAKYMGVVDMKITIFLTLLIAIPVVWTHFPYLRKENIHRI